MVVDILRAQPGESLTTVLYTPATSAQVCVSLHTHSVTTASVGYPGLIDCLCTQAVVLEPNFVFVMKLY